MNATFRQTSARRRDAPPTGSTWRGDLYRCDLLHRAGSCMTDAANARTTSMHRALDDPNC